MKSNRMNIWHKFAAYSCCLFLGIILVLLFPLNVKAEPDYGKEIIMISMGDSYSSGEGIPDFYGPDTVEKKVEDEDWLAHRSTKSWPGQLKLSGLEKEMKEYRVDLKNKEDSQGKAGKWYFVASSGALTENIFDKEQNKPYRKKDGKKTYTKEEKLLPVQGDIFNDITEEVDYITLTLGGNDVGFTDVVKSSVENVSYAEPNGLANLFIKAWTNFYKDNDSISSRLYDIYTRLGEETGKKGNIIVAGYPQLLDPAGGRVFFKLGFNEKDAKYINRNVSLFNDAIEQVVLNVQKGEGVNIFFVSVEDIFMDHRAYADKPYINKVMLLSRKDDLIDYDDKIEDAHNASAYSMHPNEKGAQAYAACVQDTIDWIEAGKPDITVSGQVIDKNDQPVRDLTVVIETAKAKKEVFRGTTNENGEFSGDIKLIRQDEEGKQDLRIIVSNEDGFLIDTSVQRKIEYGNNNLGKIKLDNYEGTMVVETDNHETTDKDAIAAMYKQTIADYDKMMYEGQLYYREKYGDTYTEADRYTYYTIVDIDGNGVDELILRFDPERYEKHVTNIDSGYGESTYVYTVKDGKVVNVLMPEMSSQGFTPNTNHLGFTKIYKGTNLINRGYDHSPMDDVFYSYQDGVLSDTPVAEITRGDGSGIINGKTATKEECEETYNRLSNGDEGYELQLYEREIDADSTADNTSGLIDEYIQFIKAKNNGSDYQNYIIYDIDKDGYPELLILVTIPEERRSVYEIYSYKSGSFEYQTQCKNCLPHIPAAYASYPNGNGMIAHFSFRGAEGVTLLSLNGHEMVDESLYLEKTEVHPTQYYLDEYDQIYADSYGHKNYLNHQFYVGEATSPYCDGSYLLGQSAMDDFTAVYEAFGVSKEDDVIINEDEINEAESTEDEIDMYNYRGANIWELGEMLGDTTPGDGDGIILGGHGFTVGAGGASWSDQTAVTNYIYMSPKAEYPFGGIYVGEPLSSAEEKIGTLGFELYEDGYQKTGNPWRTYRMGNEEISIHWLDDGTLQDLAWRIAQSR